MRRDVPATAEGTDIALDEAFLRRALRLAANDFDLDVGSRMRAAGTTGPEIINSEQNEQRRDAQHD